MQLSILIRCLNK